MLNVDIKNYCNFRVPDPNVKPALTEQKEEVKEAVEKLPDNNLELSDKPLDDGVLASLSAMFGDDEED